MLEFLWPWVFLALLALPLLRLTLPRKSNPQSALTVPNVDDFRFKDQIRSMLVSGRRWWRLLLLLLAITALVTALARPQWSGDPVPLPTEGRDMFLAIDISQSMQQTDMRLNGREATRLSALKHVVEPFIEDREGDRLGLIVFGTGAYVYVPLTADLKTVNRLLQETPVGIAGGQTAIGDTLGLAVKRLLDRPIDHRILILMTDGSHNSGVLTPEEAIDLAIDANVRVHTIGLGSERANGSYPGFNRYYRRQSFMDTENLENIATKTGGRFFRATDTNSLERIYDKIMLLEPVKQDPETLRPVKSLVHWPLLLSAILFSYLWWSRR